MHRGVRCIFPSVTRRSCLITSSLPRYQFRFDGARNAHSETSTGSEDGTSHSSDQEPHHLRQQKSSPDTTESDAFSTEFEHRIPSNKAHATLNDDYQHSGVDAEHPKRPAKEEKDRNEMSDEEQEKESVRRHNEDMERRHNRANAQVTQEGDVTSLGDQAKGDGPKEE